MHCVRSCEQNYTTKWARLIQWFHLIKWTHFMQADLLQNIYSKAPFKHRIASQNPTISMPIELSVVTKSNNWTCCRIWKEIASKHSLPAMYFHISEKRSVVQHFMLKQCSRYNILKFAVYQIPEQYNIIDWRYIHGYKNWSARTSSLIPNFGTFPNWGGTNST